GGQVEVGADAAGVGLHRPVRGVVETEPREQVSRARLGGVSRLADQAPDERQVLDAGERVVDRCVLTRETDDLAHLVRLAYDVVAADRGAPAVGSQQGREDAHGRGLSSTVRPEETKDRT